MTLGTLDTSHLVKTNSSQIYSVIWNVTAEPPLTQKLSDQATIQIAR